ncbi:hypothetical protein DPSP01_014657 [Paraphaeosphaeria sporulosa]
MAMPMLKRCSTGFTRAEPTPISSSAVDEPRSSRTLFKQVSFSKALQFTFIKQITSPPGQKSHDDTEQITDVSNAAINAADLEKDTTAAERKARKAHMATKSRVQSLRDFFSIPSPAFSALEDIEKEEYQAWHAYARQEKEMRQRYEEIAADVEVMLRGWQVDHSPPHLSAPVLTLVTEESAVNKSGTYHSGDCELPPLSQDITWNAITLIPSPSSSVRCQVCGQGPASFLGLRPMYALPCRHYLHVKCFEDHCERWLGRSGWGAAGKGARECIRCKGLKELTRILPRAELDARIRRVGDKLLNWRRNKPSGAVSADGGVTDSEDCPD